MTKRNEIPITDWEVGNMLIKWSDEMADCKEFKNSHPVVYDKVQALRRDLGDLLDSLKSHSFAIYNSKDLPTPVPLTSNETFTEGVSGPHVIDVSLFTIDETKLNNDLTALNFTQVRMREGNDMTALNFTQVRMREDKV